MSKYMPLDDEKEVTNFAQHHIFNRHATMPSGPLYHYTTGANVINIIRSGQLWATQVGCLNDSTELVYALEQLRDVIDDSTRRRQFPASAHVFSRIRSELEDLPVEKAVIFVSCFTEEGDDLTQWRSYADGEGGFALEFDPSFLRERGINKNSFLFRVNYDLDEQIMIMNDILKWTDELYLRGLQRGYDPTDEDWVNDLVHFWVGRLSPIATFLKHPKFKSEKEWRLVHYFQNEDRNKMEFVQRRSTISRHIPISYGGTDDQRRLPLTGVVIGPCRYPNVSKLGLGDLLAKYGYDPDDEVSIRSTAIPYRLV